MTLTALFRAPLRGPLRGLLVVALMGLLAGCDTVAPGNESVVLRLDLTEDASGNDLIFAFDADGFPTRRLEDVACGCSINVDAFLTSRGFSKADIVSAEIEAARLVMLFPVDERLDFLRQAILKFEASGLSATEVANQDSFGAVRELNLNVLPGRDIAGFLTRSSFNAILQIDADTLRPGEDYEISLVLTLRIEVEGL